jgi:prophage regulatory protein
MSLKTGIARATIYDWLNPKSLRYDATFPKQRRLGMQSVGWLSLKLISGYWSAALR